MSDRMALKIAIELMHVPSQVRLFRSEPLPDGVLILLRIAADDDEAEQAAVALTGRSPKTLRRAATFFIEQILFAPNADSYQVLGVGSQASGAELRRNLALLLRWLHPDLDPHGERTIFIRRVTAAWNNVKTPERRSAYDDQLRYANATSKSRRKRGSKTVDGRGNGKSFAGILPRRKVNVRYGPGIYRAGKLGFLRRALSVLFSRPAQ